VNNATPQDLYLEFKDPPQPAVPSDLFNVYIIRVKSWDIFNILTPNYYIIEMTVKNNYPPYLKPNMINFTIETIQIPFSFSKTFWVSDFMDDEGDSILIDCSSRVFNTSINAAWT
jgi:hypothetical protein